MARDSERYIPLIFSLIYGRLDKNSYVWIWVSFSWPARTFLLLSPILSLISVPPLCSLSALILIYLRLSVIPILTSSALLILLLICFPNNLFSSLTLTYNSLTLATYFLSLWSWNVPLLAIKCATSLLYSNTSFRRESILTKF